MHVTQPLEELHDREPEADQRHGCAHPCHERSLKRQASTNPTEVTVRCCPDLKTVGRFLVFAHQWSRGMNANTQSLHKAPFLCPARSVAATEVAYTSCCLVAAARLLTDWSRALLASEFSNLPGVLRIPGKWLGRAPQRRYFRSAGTCMNILHCCEILSRPQSCPAPLSSDCSSLGFDQALPHSEGSSPCLPVSANPHR